MLNLNCLIRLRNKNYVKSKISIPTRRVAKSFCLCEKTDSAYEGLILNRVLFFLIAKEEAIIN